MFRFSKRLIDIIKSPGISQVKCCYSNCSIDSSKGAAFFDAVRLTTSKTIAPYVCPNMPKHAILDKPPAEYSRIKIDRYLPVVKEINEMPLIDKEIIDPTSVGNSRIECVGWNMLVVRHKKMRKHKRKKLRKKMKYVFLKRSLRRSAMKEMAFQNEILTKLKQAEKFDAVQHVQSRLDIFNTKILPYRLKGVIMPSWVIKEAQEKREAKYKAREEKKARRAEMMQERGGTLQVE